MAGKRIKYPVNTQHQRRQRIAALAWLTQQNGGYKESGAGGVTAAIAQALADDGYPVAQQLVHADMDWLKEHGYALRVVNGRRTVEFRLLEGVEADVPEYVQARRMEKAATVREAGSVAGMDAAERAQARRERMATRNGAVGVAVVPTPVAPPVPFKPKRPAWLTDLDEVLAAWWKADPESADAWAEEAIEAVRDGLA